MELKLGAAGIETLLAREFPQMQGRFEIERVAPMEADVSMLARDEDLRPGGTVSGPAMFALADVAFYIATLAMIGPEALTVTTHCSIDFMRKPKPGELLARARILKLGRVLSVGQVVIFGPDAQAVAQATLTYSIPPARA